MELALIRHGATEWNAARRFQGSTDVPLSTLGRAHARAIAEALRGGRLERIYSSDLGRALETARAIAQATNAPVVTDARLREFDFGTWEGLTWEEIVIANPELAPSAHTAAEGYTPPGGESFADVARRVQSFLSDAAQHGHARAAVVTHAGTLHAFFGVLGLNESAPHRRISFAPGGITRVTIGEKHARLVRLNDVAHLSRIE